MLLTGHTATVVCPTAEDFQLIKTDLVGPDGVSSPSVDCGDTFVIGESVDFIQVHYEHTGHARRQSFTARQPEVYTDTDGKKIYIHSQVNE